jgi:hypothetical protein
MVSRIQKHAMFQRINERPLCAGWQQGRSTLALRGWPGYCRLVHLDAPHDPLFVGRHAKFLTIQDK